MPGGDGDGPSGPSGDITRQRSGGAWRLPVQQRQGRRRNSGGLRELGGAIAKDDGSSTASGQRGRNTGSTKIRNMISESAFAKRGGGEVPKRGGGGGNGGGGRRAGVCADQVTAPLRTLRRCAPFFRATSA
uniref:Uncharacterized protein n=1 Tax=Oryza barthii TaxID=65489 RepID=A0A0D3F904_9ORYZ